MAAIAIRLSAGYAGVSSQREVVCTGDTVGELLDDLVVHQPQLRGRLRREDGSTYLGVFLNGRNIRVLDGLDTPVTDGDEIRLVPPIAGG
jgi:MoaD family protein